jgi:hypothetical protein
MVDLQNTSDNNIAFGSVLESTALGERVDVSSTATSGRSGSTALQRSDSSEHRQTTAEDKKLLALIFAVSAQTTSVDLPAQHLPSRHTSGSRIPRARGTRRSALSCRNSESMEKNQSMGT